ncbi:MAG: hypothetical protein HQL37_01560 [Alphaproteobacteria bacterium]|nr:hypothetical protein [Alphaproteobacteria bacterium]
MTKIIAQPVTAHHPDIIQANRVAARAATARARRSRLREHADPLELRARNGADIIRVETLEGGERKHPRKVRHPLESLLARGAIDIRQHAAGMRLFNAWQIGPCRARDTDGGERLPGIRGAGGIDGLTVAALDACRDYRLALEFLGLRLSAYVLPVVCEEISVREFCARLERKRLEGGGSRQACLPGDEHGVMAVLRLGLASLADYYQY